MLNMVTMLNMVVRLPACWMVVLAAALMMMGLGVSCGTHMHRKHCNHKSSLSAACLQIRSQQILGTLDPF
jgi:hypothetical protein